MDKVKNKGKIFNWIFSVICMTCILAYGFHIGAILMCLLGVASLPIEPIRSKWEKLPSYKVLRPLSIGILFFVLMGTLPTNDTDSNNLAEVSTEVTTEAETETESEIIEIETETPQKETESEIAIATEPTKTESETEFTETESIIKVEETAAQTQPSTEVTLSVADIPAYSGNPYVTINDNVPQFLETDLTTTSYEYYSDLDNLGRCGVVYACIGQDLMPTEERGSIGHVKPTGWQTIKYDCVDGKYLYNRCHLIGYQLSGENANEKNLITGTRYMNMEGMLPFENMVADYVQETGNHVMYRVTPIFEGDNLLASGVQIEAQSVEDNGDGILFNVFCYNVQPEVIIDYASGESGLDNTSIASSNSNENSESSSTTVVPESTPTESTVTASDNSSNNQVVEEPTPEPEPQPEPTPDTGDSRLVWKTATGSKYHSHNSCGRTNPANATQITEAEAQALGLEPCSKCF